MLQNTEEEPKRPQPQLPYTGGTFHRRLQPLHTEKHKVSCSGFLPKTKPMQHPCSHYNAICNHSFKMGHRTTDAALRTTSPFPSSPLPFLTTSLPHHFPSSPLPVVTTSHRPRVPASPLPFITTSLCHHFPSSPLVPVVTTSHRPRVPASPLPFITTSLCHHFPSSPLPIVTTSHRYHFPSSPPPFVTTLCHSFFFYVMYHPSSRSIP